MSDTKQMLQGARDRFEPPEDVMGSLIRRREHKERNRRISAAVIGIAVALLGIASLMWVFRTAERPADEPTPKPPGIFSEVGGWIVYGRAGNHRGIWAVDPSRPDDPGSQVQLSSNEGTPLAWSSDGSELLISRGSGLLLSRGQLQWDEAAVSRRGLFVLHADGTETRLVRDMVSGASFSPDGTTVVFAPHGQHAHLDPGIYLIDADGGVPRLLLAPSRRYSPELDRSLRTGLSLPTFSPDGTQIAYIDGLGEWGNSLRVMNADGNDVHVLDGSDVHLLAQGEGSLGGYTWGLSWSPDGTALAVGVRYFTPSGIYVVDADGSGLTLTTPDGVNPHWSPDGSRISFDYEGHGLGVTIADRDGRHVQFFHYAASGPWNPLVQPESEVAEVPVASAKPTLAMTLLSLTIVLALAVGIVMIRHRMRKARRA